MLFISLHIFYYCSDAERVSELEVIPNTLIYHSLCNDLAASRSGFWSNGPQRHRIRRASSDTCCFHIQGTTGNDILLNWKSNIYPLITLISRVLLSSSTLNRPSLPLTLLSPPRHILKIKRWTLRLWLISTLTAAAAPLCPVCHIIHCIRIWATYLCSLYVAITIVVDIAASNEEIMWKELLLCIVL